MWVLNGVFVCTTRSKIGLLRFLMQSLKPSKKSGDVDRIINGMNDSIKFLKKTMRTVVLNVFIVLIVFLAVIFESFVTSHWCILAEFIKIIRHL